MSYSFSARAATKAEVVKKLTAELDKVVAGQAIHTKDRQNAQAAAESFLALVADPREDQDVYLSLSGSISWTGAPGAEVVTATSVSISAALTTKGPA